MRIMALLAAGAMMAADAPPAAAAGTPGMDAAFGNTIVSTYPDGRTGLLWLKRDGTYSAQGRRRTASSGRWSVKGGRICLKQSRPIAAPFSYCAPMPPDIGGVGWSAKAVTGEPIKVAVRQGRVVPDR